MVSEIDEEACFLFLDVGEQKRNHGQEEIRPGPGPADGQENAKRLVVLDSTNPPLVVFL